MTLEDYIREQDAKQARAQRDQTTQAQAGEQASSQDSRQQESA